MGFTPLQLASCPKLQPMVTDKDGTVSMGALLDKLVEVAGTYRECRASVLGKDDTTTMSTTPTAGSQVRK